MAKITIPKLGEHIVFCGTTGSGKTFLAKEMLKRYEKIFLFDTHNGLGDVEGIKITSPLNIEKKLRSFDKIRYVPDLKYRSKNWFNYVIKTLMTSKYGRGRVIYIDEIFHLGFGQSFPDWLSKGISTARQKKISIWTCSQRPTNVPMSILTESRRVYIFYLSYMEDLKKLSKFTRDEKRFLKEIESLAYDYSMIELDRIKGSWVKLSPLKI